MSECIGIQLVAPGQAPYGHIIRYSLGNPAGPSTVLKVVIARSRTSGEYLFALLITPSSQEIESPVNPGRFMLSHGQRGDLAPATKL